MKHPNLIIILLATYNGETYLGRLMESLIAQTYSNWILLARDDNSTDKTLAILRDFEKQDVRIKIISDNKGNLRSVGNFATLMEAGLQMEADRFMFCDQDDIWMDDKISRTLAAFKKLEQQAKPNQPLVSYGTFSFIDSEGRQLKLPSPNFGALLGIERLLGQNYLYGCTMMINRTLLQLSVPVPEAAENHDYWVALVNAAYEGGFTYTPEPLLFYRQHGANVSGTYKDAYLKNRIGRIFSKSTRNRLIKRTAMFRELADRIRPVHGDTSLIIDQYNHHIHRGGISAVLFCWTNKIYNRGFFQGLAFFLLLLRKNRGLYVDKV